MPGVCEGAGGPPVDPRLLAVAMHAGAGEIRPPQPEIMFEQQADGRADVRVVVPGPGGQRRGQGGGRRGPAAALTAPPW